MAGNVGDHQFLFIPYEPLQGTAWIIDGAGGQPSPLLDQQLGSAPAQTGGGTQHSSRASMHTVGATGRTGSLWFEPPGQENHACQIDPSNIVTIMGESEGLFSSDPQTDPCSNLPITGTAVRSR